MNNQSKKSSSQSLTDTPKNPTQEELEASLNRAEFPTASHMSKEIFGEHPDEATNS